jgi:cytochrome c biogenesis protein CcmG/thiol:disulfide interchange protein DsbE
MKNHMSYSKAVAAAAVFVLVMLAVASIGSEGKAPDFALPNLDGKNVKLSQLLSQGPVLVDFWATWCKPCIKGFPALQQLHEKYRERGLTVLAVSVDSPKSRSRVAPFIKSQKFTFEVLLDTEGKVAQKYNAVAIPRTVLISSQGEIVYTSVGYKPTNEERLDEAVRSVLSAKTSGEGPIVQ